MINQQLLDFIKQQLLKGVDKETITKELLEGGYAEKDIQEEFNTINNNPVISPTSSNNINVKTPIIKKKYSIKKKIIIMIIILFCIYGYIKLKYSTYTPLLETCIQSDVLAKDRISHNFIKYVDCMKGYTVAYGLGDAQRIVSQRTSGYVIFSENGNYISTISLERHSDNNFRQGVSPDFYFKDKNLFVTINDNSETNAIPDFKSALLSFGNDKINKIRDIPFERRYIIAYENYTIFYFNYDNQTVVKEDLLTGKSSDVVDLNIIKRDKTYGDHYSYPFCSYKENNNLMTSFEVIVAVNEKTSDQTREYYSLDLNSGKLSKIVWNGDYIVFTHCEPPNLELYPASVKYSKIEGEASTYNLQYDPNPKMDIYSFLLFLKHGIPVGTYPTSLN